MNEGYANLAATVRFGVIEKEVRGPYRFFFLWRSLRRRFFLLWVAIFLRFLFLPLGITSSHEGATFQ
jgi:hypothetical protein